MDDNFFNVRLFYQSTKHAVENIMPKTKYVEDLLDTDVSDDTDIYDDSSSEEEGDEYDDDPY